MSVAFILDAFANTRKIRKLLSKKSRTDKTGKSYYVMMIAKFKNQRRGCSVNLKVVRIINDRGQKESVIHTLS